MTIPPEARREEGIPLDPDRLTSTLVPNGPELESAGGLAFDATAWSRRLQRWGAALVQFFLAQGVVQGAGLAAGLLFVRRLPIDDFAAYTLASSMLVSLVFFTDLGSSAALLHFAHRARSSGVSFAPYVAAVFSLRRRLFALIAPAIVLLLALWGTEKALSEQWIAVVAFLVVITAWVQIGSTLDLLRLRLDGAFPRSYRAEAAGALTRLGLAVLVVALPFVGSAGAVATALAGAVVTAFLARTPVPPVGDALAGARREVVRYLLPTLPSAVYFAVQGQLIVWISAAVGGTSTLAEVGALTRLGLIIGLFSSLSGIVLLPRLVQHVDERSFRRRYLAFGASLAAVGGGLVAASMTVPDLFLSLLGPSYRGLRAELTLVVATSALSLLGGYLVAVNNARSWTRWQPLALGLLVATQVLFAWKFPLGTTAGALRFGVASAVASLAGQAVIAAVGFARPRWVRW